MSTLPCRFCAAPRRPWTRFARVSFHLYRAREHGINPGHGALAMTFIFNTGVLIDHRPEQQQDQAILIFTKYIVGLPVLTGASYWVCLAG